MPKQDIDPSFLEQMKHAWERRQAAQAMIAPKSLHDTTQALRKSMYEPARVGYFTEGKMLKARCKGLAGHNKLVGNTVFSFDKDGLTQVHDRGYARYDYETLLTLNGVCAVEDKLEEPKLDEPKKAKVQDKSPEPEAEEYRACESDSAKHSESEKEEQGGNSLEQDE